MLNISTAVLPAGLGVDSHNPFWEDQGGNNLKSFKGGCLSGFWYQALILYPTSSSLPNDFFMIAHRWIGQHHWVGTAKLMCFLVIFGDGLIPIQCSQGGSNTRRSGWLCLTHETSPEHICPCRIWGGNAGAIYVGVPCVDTYWPRQVGTLVLFWYLRWVRQYGCWIFWTRRLLIHHRGSLTIELAGRCFNLIDNVFQCFSFIHSVSQWHPKFSQCQHR